jgi:glycosyltransferase involved in cell wall biosynthesis
VHSREAKESVLASTGADADWITDIPDPLEPWDGSPAAKRDARERLDLPAEGTVLLLFGQLVEEKGIDALLRALERYDGPAFTMVIAGSPVAVTPEEIEETARRSAVDVRPRLEFVPEADVEAYFVAADGVVLPYERSFGAARTSGVFQKACAAGRPILASDFGVFGRRVREWDLGVLCEPGSPERIAGALGTLVERGEAVYDAERMDEYACSQTFERLAELAHEAYRDVAAEP